MSADGGIPAALPAAAAPPGDPALDTLDRLAAERATGALHGRGGALYLADGVVVHAESHAVPDVGCRLTVGGRLPAECWEEAVARGGPGHGAGRFLVEHGRLTAGELELCHLSALFDAAYFVLCPLDRTQRGPQRFLREARHWFGPVRPVPVPLLRRETARRARLLERAWPRPEVDTSPVVPVAGRAARETAARGRGAVLAAADGQRTPLQIACTLGRSAFTTLLDVRRLAAAGLVRTPERGAPAAPAPPRPGTAAAPDITLLYRIRDALEAL
ncbi:hypothetical protein GCM10010218_46300 [Streptomyces mashuensis]|uniref:Uncharacterized protein n=1 Tax=Streptomyces mashuensis TaxID=33904 RepID=A0A919B5G6_9ACTN|nr:transcriptional regulator [Streptomyces mashuensis]GHF59504.1 hypothetical protein GCM10010218_46300 [Streptomyces mashuensis]